MPVDALCEPAMDTGIIAAQAISPMMRSQQWIEFGRGVDNFLPGQKVWCNENGRSDLHARVKPHAQAARPALLIGYSKFLGDNGVERHHRMRGGTHCRRTREWNWTQSWGIQRMRLLIGYTGG